ncbi:MAG: hypothetical protein KGZ81_04535 [Flavobacteriales bacterium]|nr:hypothetical protein [Flavobacteriales bacterium]
MKKLFIPFLILYVGVLNAQTINIKEKIEYIPGVYFKDIDQVFDQFTGTYRYQNGNQLFEIKFQKKVYVPIDGVLNCHIDMLVGGYKHFLDGLELHNGLAQTGTFPDPFFELACSEMIQIGPAPGCNECNVGESFVIGIINNPGGNASSTFYARKITHNGLPAIRILIHYSLKVSPENSPSPTNLYPLGEFIMVKVD